MFFLWDLDIDPNMNYVFTLTGKILMAPGMEIKHKQPFGMKINPIPITSTPQ